MRFVSIIIAVIFFFTNCIWAGPLNLSTNSLYDQFAAITERAKGRENAALAETFQGVRTYLKQYLDIVTGTDTRDFNILKNIKEKTEELFDKLNAVFPDLPDFDIDWDNIAEFEGRIKAIIFIVKEGAKEEIAVDFGTDSGEIKPSKDLNDIEKVKKEAKKWKNVNWDEIISKGGDILSREQFEKKLKDAKLYVILGDKDRIEKRYKMADNVYDKQGIEKYKDCAAKLLEGIKNLPKKSIWELLPVRAPKETDLFREIDLNIDKDTQIVLFETQEELRDVAHYDIENNVIFFSKGLFDAMLNGELYGLILANYAHERGERQIKEILKDHKIRRYLLGLKEKGLILKVNAHRLAEVLEQEIAGASIRGLGSKLDDFISEYIKKESIVKSVYFFGGRENTEGNKNMKDLLGGKGANLCEMALLGLPIPAGFIVTTEVCKDFHIRNEFQNDVEKEIRDTLKRLEEYTGQKLGSSENPLLLSIRSGAPISMPGMMDTILNVGMNEETAKGLIHRGLKYLIDKGKLKPEDIQILLNKGLSGLDSIKLSNLKEDEKKEIEECLRFVFDTYRRFIQMFSDVVLGVERKIFEEKINEVKRQKGYTRDVDMTSEDLRDLVKEFKDIVKKETKKEFPTDPYTQIIMAVKAVFKSWNNDRAKRYRRMNKIPEDLGTACNIQAMVFGNLNFRSGSGVAFTRDPTDGRKTFYGEYLTCAQGEDVVAGIRTPQAINEVSKKEVNREFPSLEELMPEVYNELDTIQRRLERHFKDMQDLEFTIEDGKLWILQTRSGKRTGWSALKIAVDMYDEGLITKKEAILRVKPEQIDELLHDVFDPEEKDRARAMGNYLTKGLGASPGAAVGRVVFNSKDAEDRAEKNPEAKTILVREETSPDDIGGMQVSQGILTARGGATSHAALVARGMGKPCVCGASEIVVGEDKDGKYFVVKGKKFREGGWISIDGYTGEVFSGEIPTKASEIIEVLINETKKREDSVQYKYFERFMQWAYGIRQLGIMANADTPKDARIARLFGAEGIGLVRTEHMFFDVVDKHTKKILEHRVQFIQEMILAKTPESRKTALEKLCPYQEKDFEGIFRAMLLQKTNGEKEALPVTIRLLDPPMHEFLPQEIDYKLLGLQMDKVKDDIKTLKVKLKKVKTEIAKENIKRRIEKHMVTFIELKTKQKTIKQLADKMGITYNEFKDLVVNLYEANPMMGHRGCRLGITNPEIYKMQVRAILKTACELNKEGLKVKPEIMIPLVSNVEELIYIKENVIIPIASLVFKEEGFEIEYKIGTMIETPRASVTSEDIAKIAEFFSYGTNDLTQMTFGFSRDDVRKFLRRYEELGVMGDPFIQLDQGGVGKLIMRSLVGGRKVRPNLKAGICGEHGGDPSSIEFCHVLGMDYVSMSPYRIPVAIIAAAQAAIKYGEPTSKYIGDELIEDEKVFDKDRPPLRKNLRAEHLFKTIPIGGVTIDQLKPLLDELGAKEREFPIPEGISDEKTNELILERQIFIDQAFIRMEKAINYIKDSLSEVSSFLSQISKIVRKPSVYAFRFEDVIAEVEVKDGIDLGEDIRVIGNPAIAKTIIHLKEKNPDAKFVIFSDKPKLVEYNGLRMKSALNAIEAGGVFDFVILGDEKVVASKMKGKGDLVIASSKGAEGIRTVVVNRSKDSEHRSIIPFDEVVFVMTEMLDASIETGLEQNQIEKILNGYEIWLQQAGYNGEGLEKYLEELKNALKESKDLSVTLPIPPLPKAGSLIGEMDKEYLQEQIQTYA